jgi:hypothetical protein
LSRHRRADEPNLGVQMIIFQVCFIDKNSFVLKIGTVYFTTSLSTRLDSHKSDKKMALYWKFVLLKEKLFGGGKNQTFNKKMLIS